MSSLSFAPVVPAPSTSTSALSPSNRYSSTEIVDEEANLSDTMIDHIMQAESLYNDDDDDDDDDDEADDFDDTIGSYSYASNSSRNKDNSVDVEYNIRQTPFDRLEHLSRFYKNQTDDKGAVRESMEMKANLIKGLKDNMEVASPAANNGTDQNSNEGNIKRNDNLRFSTSSSIHSANTDTVSGSYSDIDLTFNTSTSTSTSASISASASHAKAKPSSSVDFSYR